MEKLIKEAFIAGYEQGHNDTVECGYGCSPDKADEYYLDISNQVQAVVKPACEYCKYLKVEGGKLYAKTELCQNGKIRLWNLTNCDIDTTEFGCTYFESKSV